ALLRLMDDLNDDRSMVRLLQAKLNQKTLRDLREAQWGWPNAHSGEGRPSLLALCLRLPDAPNCLPGLPQTIRGALG
ncbi:hypothetical protein ACKI2C_52320, partial [Streptomyces brasiliscabiei]|uniref:hypothetical protein n=1 Tax=Streptomyces brasiliscabiei TaxID=2736302 RepID=UPI0038F82111